MKFVAHALITVALLFSAQVAEAKPKAKPAPETKAAFTCAIVKLDILTEIQRGGFEKFNALLRLHCTNTGKTQAMIDLAHVFLEDEEYETDPSTDIDIFNQFYGDDSSVEFGRRTFKVAAGKSSDFVLYFEDVRSAWGVGLVLDIDGAKHPLPVLPH